jgi:SAM-dependent methyltransferase/archaellum component FlaC
VIETTVPEINITELMERVRAAALRPKLAPPRRTPRDETASPLPPVAMLPAAPAVWIPGPVKSRKERLDALLETARLKNEPVSKIPKFLRRFFRKQGGYNRAVVESIAALSKTNDDVTRRLAEITTCLGQFNSWLLALHEQSDADANWMKAAAPGVSLAKPLEKQIKELAFELGTKKDELEAARATLTGRIEAAEAQSAKRFESVRSDLKQLRDTVTEQRRGSAEAAAAAEKLATQTQGLQADFEQVGVHLRNLQAHVDASFARHSQQVDDLQRQIDNAGLHLRNLQAETDRIGTHVVDLQAQADRLGTHVNNLQALVDQRANETNGLRDSLEKRVSDVVNDSAFVKGELSEYGLLLQRLLAKEFKGPAAAKISGAPKTGPLGLDTFYFNFENRFRGTRDEIKSRVAFYLPLIRKAGAGTARKPVLDLGCGRGEWLELLKDHKLEGRGVDLNATMAAQCKDRGLKVRHADVMEHLRSLRANSQGAVTGFHIIEHLPFETLMELFGEVRRVLQPAGVAIFESPNCKNLMVGACNFNIDPTHRNPVFPETAEFMLASHGFEKIRIEYLSAVAEPGFNGSTPELAKIKELLYGPQDFGVIAYKPAKR